MFLTLVLAPPVSAGPSRIHRGRMEVSRRPWPHCHLLSRTGGRGAGLPRRFARHVVLNRHHDPLVVNGTPYDRYLDGGAHNPPRGGPRHNPPRGGPRGGPRSGASGWGSGRLPRGRLPHAFGEPVRELYTEADLPAGIGGSEDPIGRPGSTRSRAGSTSRCTAGGCGRCASSRGSARARRPTSASTTCSRTGRPGSPPPSTCPR